MLNYSITKGANGDVVTIVGRITEAAEPTLAAIGQLAGARFELDCAGVDGANSVGTRLWSALMATLSSRGLVVLARCSVFFVDYGNMAPSLVKSARFRSVQVPLQCSGCGRESTMLLEARDFGLETLALGACASCGQRVELQTPLADYLRVVRHQSLD